MYPALVVFWLGSSPTPVEPPPEVARWAAQLGYRAVTVPAAVQPAYAEQAALEIERLLEEARSLPSAVQQLERVDQLLELHPELPQAGWWLAERRALQRQQARDAQDPGAAARAELQRAALEGPREETAGAPAAEAAAPAPPPLTLELLGVRPHDQLLLDGEPVSAGSTVAPGRHHAQLFRAQRRVWAGWLELDSARVQLPEVSPPCSELDLLGTAYAAGAARAAPGVSCAVWAVAHARADQTQLALCHADRCERWQSLGAAPGGAAAARASDAPPAERLPAWLTWGAVGLGVAASSALVLWQAGVFDRSAPASEFVFTGPSAAAVRF